MKRKSRNYLTETNRPKKQLLISFQAIFVARRLLQTKPSDPTLLQMVDCLRVRIDQLEDQLEDEESESSDSSDEEGQASDEGYHDDGSGSN